MKFENNPQLILTKDEMETLNKALTLCQNMDEQISGGSACKRLCPLCSNCTTRCAYRIAYEALQKIIDVAVVK